MPTMVQRINTTKSVSFEDTSIAFSSQSNGKLLKTYWLFALMNQGWLVNLGTFFIKLAFKLQLPVKKLIKSTIFEQFCGGETIQDCEKTIQKLHDGHVGTILDYSVEGEGNEASFDETTLEILRTIERASESDAIPFSVFKVTGIGSTYLLEKVQAGDPLTDAELDSYERVHQRVDLLCKRASELNIRIFIDAEETWIQDTIDKLAYEMMDRYNHQQCIVYNTYQLYRSDSFENLRKSTETARSKGYFLGAKLVRGAYIEKERIQAHEGEYLDPIHHTKEETDRDFNEAVEFCLVNRDTVSICLGTHNEYSCHNCISRMQELGIAPDDRHIWFAQLLGMSDNISYNLADAGYNVAKYVPYGPVEAVMPYLFRRAAENKSIAGQSSREYLLVKNELQRRKSCQNK